jgi:hypothetical protein
MSVIIEKADLDEMIQALTGSPEDIQKKMIPIRSEGQKPAGN